MPKWLLLVDMKELVMVNNHLSMWKDLSLAQIDGQYDVSRLHFTGNLPYSDYLAT